LVAGQQVALLGLAARIPHHPGRPAGERERLVAGELEPSQAELAEQVPDVQRIGGRVEPDVDPDRPFRQPGPEELQVRRIVDQPTRGEVVDQVHGRTDDATTTLPIRRALTVQRQRPGSTGASPMLRGTPAKAHLTKGPSRLGRGPASPNQTDRPPATRGGRLMSARVVVGIDGSPEARSALRWAGWYAGVTGAELHAVHAWQ